MNTNQNINTLDNFTHPLTCGCISKRCFRVNAYNNRAKGIKVEYNDENEGVLISTDKGLICPCGDYKQNWKENLISLTDYIKYRNTNKKPQMTRLQSEFVSELINICNNNNKFKELITQIGDQFQVFMDLKEYIKENETV